jgi:hypothetical protein
MTTEKVALSVPAETLRLAREQVRSGRAKSLSAFVSAAVDEKVRREELEDILNAMDKTYGPPSKAAERWAKRVLAR